ncbi:MAG: hypothetical protein COT39_02605 [Parcubacteria group bacterium CG08_land_8_20_14_0_20_48_21]|nr:MAG: hypothetical protein AUK21_02730 [Parcubacteria group bacterium CG2_30_48_51]PIS32821.1 MAG: hypothetical protein COT39_02605 [Parcubacteria group bacterium CG08_land_8_20_14_0_20_48_21]PIW79341.1 MAG: hypothetical protein COZ99_01655 [Parcubacteria group bacterium CG_4_8_14_3_um_filter_48_16]PIY78081.1 MAG: hypothetical protein COY83_01810 [Parcubacteria group bacterium CG_4_10_14_0_8_um_filter_48_154]PIZ76922.1 MAG: hypothetical protein COY03_04395 [bacterium CG_4_10_14_0_2_um_filter_
MTNTIIFFSVRVWLFVPYLSLKGNSMRCTYVETRATHEYAFIVPAEDEDRTWVIEIIERAGM